jgi:hypothetical protein
MGIDVTKLSNGKLEDMLLDLCGRLTLSNKEVELLQAVEEEIERRLKEGSYEVSKMG